jgi:hypothetical protein
MNKLITALTVTALTCAGITIAGTGTAAAYAMTCDQIEVGGVVFTGYGYGPEAAQEDAYAKAQAAGYSGPLTVIGLC